MARKQKTFDTETRTFVTPINSHQSALVESIYDNSITLVSGPSGSGKTLLSIQTLYHLYKAKQIDQILVIRLIADSFGEHLGSLPGLKDEKLYHFLGPIVDNLSQFLPPGEVEALINQKVIEAIPVSHCRGRSFSRKGVLIEESQNLTDDMLLCIVTRIAKQSRMVFNGDPNQVDFAGRNGISYLHKLLDNLKDVGVIQFFPHEIVRHELISSILKRANNIQAANKIKTSSTIGQV